MNINDFTPTQNNNCQKIAIERIHRNSSSRKSFYITKTHLYNFDPLIPHFYIVKLGFTGVYIIFLISAQKTLIVGTR